MDNSQPPITLDEIKHFRDELNDLFPDDPTKKVNVYSPEVKQFYEIINSKRIGIPKGTNPKEIGIILEKWYEWYSNTTPAPEYVSNTILTPEQIKNFDKDVERQKKSEEIRANQKNETERFEKRNKEIYAEQQKIQEKILKAKTVQPEVEKLKPLYIKIEEVEKVQFTPEEKTVFEEYKKEAVTYPEETTIKLAQEIHSRADQFLKAQGLPEEEVEVAVNRTAQRIVENLTESTKLDYITPIAHLAINNAVYEKVQTSPKMISVQQTRDVLLSSIGTTTKYRFLPDVFLEKVTETAFGPTVAKTIFGSNYKVTVSEVPTQGFTYTYSLSQANENGRQIFEEQNQTLQKLQSFVGSTAKDEARNYLLNQSATYFTKTPLGEKILSNPKAQAAFYTVFKGAGQTVTWTGTGTVGNLIVKSGYAPVVNLVTGKFVTPVITQTTTKVAGQIVGKAAGQLAGEVATQVAVKTGVSATLSATFGTALSWIPGIGTAIGIAAGWVVGKVIEKINWPKIKKWFSENGWIFATGAGVGGAILFGAGPGVAIGFGALALTGGLATFLTGAFGVLGFIGRSLGVAIATPVIVTLLVLPPLVAFIMLVINNSAYIVPPSPLSSNPSQVITSPYIDVVKTPNPPGPFENNELPLTVEYTVEIKAKKGNLSNININYECSVIKKLGSAVCPNTDPAIPTTVSVGISPTIPFKFSYKQTYSALGFNDSFVTDVITVTADVTEQVGVSAAGSATIKIGDPPEDCPSIWPTSHGYITQGAYTPTSCGDNCSHSTTESIDVGVSNTGVVATHTGTVVKAEKDSCYGNRVWVKSNCNGKDFISQYAHLEGISIRNGQLVTMGQNIGLSGNTGTCTSGPHLHYEFRYYPDGKPSFPSNPPFMNNPYLPSNIKRGCKTTAECGVSF